MDGVISKWCYKERILQRNYRKFMVVSYNTFVKFQGKKMGFETQRRHCVIRKLCYKGRILQRNYRKITISWSFPYNIVVKFQGKKQWDLRLRRGTVLCL